MKRLILSALFGALLASACTTSATGSPANLIGTQALVLVDQLQSDGVTLATEASAVGTDVGVPNHYLFITSGDTNELRVLNLFRPGLLGRTFVQAPNPLETLSIPVLDRPEKLTADEGLDSAGRRVTGVYVYAARTGGDQLSVVDATPAGFAQITRTPLALPGPLTAFAGWMGAGLTTVPSVTHLYFSTWNGSASALYDLALPTTRAASDLRAAKPVLVASFGSSPISSLKVVAALAGRTSDGAAFCDTTDCLVVATRANQGVPGSTVMLDPKTLKTATVGFPTAVRELTPVGGTSNLWGVLSEEECNASYSGGVIGVDTKTAISPGGFPLLTDFTGQVMVPLATGGIPRGLSVLSGDVFGSSDNYPVVQLTVLRDALDAGTSGIQQDDAGVRLLQAVQQFVQIGVFSNANGEYVPFDASNRIPIDYDGRRPALIAATQFVPLTTEDGGIGFLLDDGGANYTQFDAGISPYTHTGNAPDLLNDTVYNWNIDPLSAGQPAFSLSVADGLLLSQTFTVANQGIIPGFSQVQTSGTSTLLSFTAGLESRLANGDRVLFGAPLDDGGIVPCGDSHVVGFDAGVLEVDAVPSNCPNVTAYTVRAQGTDPVIVTGDNEGFIARTHVGATVTYNRRYQTMPAGFDGVHSALIMNIGAIDPTPSSYWAFKLDGHLRPIHVAIDPGVGCNPYVPGPIVMGRLPYYTTAVPSFPWEVLALYPAGNGVVEFPMGSTLDDLLANMSSGQGVICYR